MTTASDDHRDQGNVRLSVEEVQVLLNTLLTLGGVPFVSTTKPKLPISDDAIERLRDSLHKATDPVYEELSSLPRDERWSQIRVRQVGVILSQSELKCLAVALQAVLDETADAPGQLHALIASREKVAAILDRITQVFH